MYFTRFHYVFVTCFVVLLSEVRSDHHLDFDYSNARTFEFLGSNAGKPSENMTASLNEYLDQVVTGLNSQISYPIIIPDHNISVNTEILMIPLVGVLKFYNGQVKQVGTVSRSGNADAKYTNEILTLSLALQVDNVQFSGDFVAKFEVLGPSGSTAGTIEQLLIEAELEVDVNKIQVTVNDFYMEAKSIDLTVKVLPVLDWFLNGLIKLLVYIIQWPLLSMISSDVKGQLQQVFDGYTQIFH